MENGLDDIESNETDNCKFLREYISSVEHLIKETNANYKENPGSIKKVCDTSIHCGKIDGAPAYIKPGKYGYYMRCGKNGKTKVSLKDFRGFDIEHKINQQNGISEEELKLLIEFIKKGKEIKNNSILVVLNADYSIRESKYGHYLYYKSKKMKQPKFMKYNDENDNKKEIRNNWIQENNIEEIRNYLREKYKINI
jgi:hypothetical protein